MDPILRDSLSSLGITVQNHRVLMLLPLVYVAWADGRMEDVEIERIDEIAKTTLHLNKSGLDILDGWLEEQPAPDYFTQGLQDLFLLAQTEEGEPLVHPEELHDLLMHAEAIARATGHALDAPTSISPEEDAALHDIAAILGVDNGISWAKLLDELDAGPASIERRVPTHRPGT
jgi:tellurite resistance protein